MFCTFVFIFSLVSIDSRIHFIGQNIYSQINMTLIIYMWAGHQNMNDLIDFRKKKNVENLE